MSNHSKPPVCYCPAPTFPASRGSHPHWLVTLSTQLSRVNPTVVGRSHSHAADGRLITLCQEVPSARTKQAWELSPHTPLVCCCTSHTPGARRPNGGVAKQAHDPNQIAKCMALPQVRHHLFIAQQTSTAEHAQSTGAPTPIPSTTC